MTEMAVITGGWGSVMFVRRSISLDRLAGEPSRGNCLRREWGLVREVKYMPYAKEEENVWKQSPDLMQVGMWACVAQARPDETYPLMMLIVRGGGDLTEIDVQGSGPGTSAHLFLYGGGITAARYIVRCLGVAMNLEQR